MTTSQNGFSQRNDNQFLQALIRSLTNLLNQGERHHRKHIDNNRLNGVLLEDALTRLERIEETQKRIYALGMFWSDGDHLSNSSD